MQTAEALMRIERALARPSAPSSDFDLTSRDATAGWSRATGRPAAVLLGLRDGPDGARLLLTRRAAGLRHHPGQIALPGGRLEASDPSAEAAALREAEEEVGLAPAQVRLVGRMAPHHTVTGFDVTPVIGVIEGDFLPRPDRREVAEIFEVPFAHVTDPARFGVERRPWQGGWRAYDVVPWGPYYIWGATARILRRLAEGMAA